MSTDLTVNKTKVNIIVSLTDQKLFLKRSCIFLLQKQIPHQQLSISVNFPPNIETKLISNHQNIWWKKKVFLQKIWWKKKVFHSNFMHTFSLYWTYSVFINYLKEKQMCLPALQNQHGACFRTRGESKFNVFFILLVFNFMRFPSKWFFF